MNHSEKLNSCPFCGAKEGMEFALDSNQGWKYGSVICSCGAHGPEVRTNYHNGCDEDWHEDAVEAWNRRSQNG